VLASNAELMIIFPCKISEERYHGSKGPADEDYLLQTYKDCPSSGRRGLQAAKGKYFYLGGNARIRQESRCYGWLSQKHVCVSVAS